MMWTPFVQGEPIEVFYPEAAVLPSGRVRFDFVVEHGTNPFLPVAFHTPTGMVGGYTGADSIYLYEVKSAYLQAIDQIARRVEGFLCVSSYVQPDDQWMNGGAAVRHGYVFLQVAAQPFGYHCLSSPGHALDYAVTRIRSERSESRHRLDSIRAAVRKLGPLGQPKSITGAP